MTEHQHTPGPWDAIEQHRAGPMIAHRYDTGNQMHPTGLRLICHMLQRGNSLQQDRANARLIASAPDMLAELKRLVAKYGDQLTADIIAKAEGRG